MKLKNLARAAAGAALGLTLAFGTAAPALAATITIQNPAVSETYTAYKLFDVISNAGHSAYSYSTASEDLVEVLTSDAAKEAGVNLTFSKAAGQNVWYVSGLDDTTEAASLAKYIHDNWTTTFSTLLTQSFTSSVAGDTVTIDTGNVTGYFYVTSTLGSLCALNTVESTQTITEKNVVPTIEKKVEGKENISASIGDVLDFEVTINAKRGAEGYVLHDALSDGLTLDADTITVKAGDDTLEGNGADYTLSTSGFEDDCDYEIAFTKTYLDSLTEDTVITVTYQATVNSDAEVQTSANKNTAVLDYGSKSHTIEKTTETWVYDFDITKVDDKKQPLSGAEFSLYDQETGGDAITLVDLGEGKYRVATADDSTTTTTIVVNGDGKASVSGLEGTEYWLEETKAPEGYNMLTSREHVTFTTDDDGVFDADDHLDDVTVENKAGSILPGTGGMGTTALYIVGGVLVAGAGITLVVRRRMSAEA